MVTSPRQPGQTFVVAGNGTLWMQDPAGGAPTWIELPTPNVEPGEGDSGNNFLAIGGSVDAPLLFYCAKTRLYVAPAPPQAAADWRRLDDAHRVHLDLHGVFLSADFAAVIDATGYQATSGTVWLLSDGGIHRSTDGGKSFEASSGLSTLATVNIGGLAIPRKTALCLNCGDNAGFYSLNGGQSWMTLTYNGGDNDCSFADPLQPDRMLVFTPREGPNGSALVYVGVPPDGTGLTGLSYRFDGPPRPQPRDGFDGAGTDNWNAGSVHGMRGYRPVVHGLWGESGPGAGDYVFIRYKTDSTAVLLRTKASDEIEGGVEFDTEALSESGGGNVFQVGPPLPSNDIDLAQASGGHNATVFLCGRRQPPSPLEVDAGHERLAAPRARSRQFLRTPILRRSVSTQYRLHHQSEPRQPVGRRWPDVDDRRQPRDAADEQRRSANRSDDRRTALLLRHRPQ